MSRVLLVSKDVNINALIYALKCADYDEIYHVTSGHEARLRLSQFDYDLVIVNAPLKDENGHELAMIAAENSMANVIMFVREEIADVLSAKVEDYGILIIPKPFSKEMFYRILKLISVTRNRFLILDKENKKLREKISDIRLISRAKYALIEYGGLSEMDAHRYIEKTAMDNRKSRREIAKQVLEKYCLDD